MSVELHVWSKAQWELQDRRGVVPVRQFMATALFEVHPEQPLVEGLFDTGAPLTVFPQSVWKWLPPAQIEWLTDDGDAGLPRWLRFVSGLTGGAIPCRIARVTVSLTDDRRSPLLADLPIIAKLAQNEDILEHRILIGCYGLPLDLGFLWTGGARPRAVVQPQSAATEPASIQPA